MAKEFKLPDLGEGIHEAQVINLMVKQGDAVKEDQMVMEVETDKAAVELPVPFAGVIAKLNVKVGDTVKVGEVLLAIEEKGGAPSSPPAPKAAPPPAPSRPDAAPGPVKPAPPPPAVVEPAARPAARSATAGATASGPIPAAPAVRRLARELGIDLRSLHGTGPGGRVVREDVERFQLTGTATGVATPTRIAEEAPPLPTRSASEGRAVPAEALPDFSQWGPIRREALTQIRKTIARQMVRSVTTIPHVTHADEVDVTDLENFRKEQSAIFGDRGKLTLTAFVIKSVAGALRQFPQLNASYDEARGEMIFKDYVHVGVAVDSPKGLMVPVIRDADRKGLLTISQELRDLAEKARDFKLDIAQMRGGTFTVTNVGALGGTMSTPIINYPEVAILGMGKLDWKPVVRDGQIVPRKMLPLFLSFDHRVIDGADGARFIRAVMSFLENPLNLLLVS
jgi:pyruvate dehydrogenase E2 component (dihydrolipoamide acetyltransferase)